MTTTNEQHVAPPEAWDAIARGYDAHVSPMEVRLANEALRLAGVTQGTRLCDVAAGCGGLTVPAAKLGASVLATDWSAAMIEAFEASVRAEGITGAVGRVMDAHALDLPDDSFDVVASQFGVMLVADQPRALREMVRVTKPGGHVLLICYGDPSRFETLGVFIAALTAVSPKFEGLPDDPPPLEFQAADPEVLRARLVDAGLSDVRVEPSSEVLEVSSGRQVWDWALGSNPIAGMLTADLDDEQEDTMRRVLDGIIRERAEADGVTRLRAAVNIGIGTK